MKNPVAAGERSTGPISPALYILTVFTVSRIMVFLAGVRFDAARLGSLHQFIDPQLLKTRLLESLFYLHGQPPLFNLYLGLVLKCFPHTYGYVFHLVHIILGLTMTFAAYRLMTGLGVNTRIAARASALLAANPACILYENWLFYTYMTCSLLCVSAWVLHCWMQSEKKRYGLLFFSLLAGIGLIRSMFHLVWFIGAVGVVLAASRGRWRRTMALALLPLALLMSVYVKNYVLYGEFTTSTWLGMNLFQITGRQMPRNLRLQYIQSGLMSPLALKSTFRRLRIYKPCISMPSKTGEPLLDNPLKTTDAKNLNDLAFIEISKRYYQDSVAAIVHDPPAYAKGIAKAWYLHFVPSTYYLYLHQNRMKILPYIRVYNTLIYGQMNEHFVIDDYDGSPGETVKAIGHLGLFLIVAYGVSLAFGAAQIKRLIRSGDYARSAVIAYMLWTILFVSLTGNSLEVDENNRFRFLIDPFLYILIAYFISNYAQRWINHHHLGTRKTPSR
ncbi:MAG: hypothetical protein GC154_16020 [bacterium]|nr:hypothetical protein [bacterium]